MVWPITLIVDEEAEAMEVSFFGTEPIISLVLAGEKIPNPTPRSKNEIIKTSKGVLSDNIIISINPMPPIIPPITANSCGSYLSDSLPAIGETITCTTGAISNIRPA